MGSQVRVKGQIGGSLGCCFHVKRVLLLLLPSISDRKGRLDISQVIRINVRFFERCFKSLLF